MATVAAVLGALPIVTLCIGWLVDATVPRLATVALQLEWSVHQHARGSFLHLFFVSRFTVSLLKHASA